MSSRAQPLHLMRAASLQHTAKLDCSALVLHILTQRATNRTGRHWSAHRKTPSSACLQSQSHSFLLIAGLFLYGVIARQANGS